MKTYQQAMADYQDRMAREATGIANNGEAWEKRMAGAGRGDTYRDMHETKEFMPAVIELAERRGWRVYHTHDSRRSAKGFPDLCMVRNGSLIFAELKSEKGVTTPEQQAWLADLLGVIVEGAAVNVYLWRPEQWHDGTIERALR